MKILECSSIGDKRFSESYAKIDVNNKLDSIENHYQLSKRFLINGKLVAPKNSEEVKGKMGVCFQIGEKIVSIEHGKQFYKLMWYKYLVKNKNLIEVLSQYEGYSNTFKTESEISQDDVISKFMLDNGKTLKKECEDLIRTLNDKSLVYVEEGDLLDTWHTVIGHQVNCLGVMGSGIAKVIKEFYPNVFKEYAEFSKSKSKELLGQCEFVKVGEYKYVANIFGQYSFGLGKDNTDYIALELALKTLKSEAIKKGLYIALPFKIASDRAGGDWNRVLKIIKNVFSDYPVALIKLNK